MAKVVTLGEIMLRLSSPGQKRFVQSDVFDVVYGGGEANWSVIITGLVLTVLSAMLANKILE